MAEAKAAELNWYLPGSKLERLSDFADNKLEIRLALTDSHARFTLLDCFDQSLRRQGRLLLEGDEGLELLQADGGALRLEGARKGNFVADLPAGPLRQALEDLSPLRALLPVGAGQIRHGQLTLLDDQQKTRARAVLRILSQTSGKDAVVVTLQGLRGYDKALRRLQDHLQSCGAKPLAKGGLYTRLFADHTPYDPKPRIPIGPDDRAFDAASDLIARHIPIARANEAGIIADLDTEFLHDYRIALRKIRSVLSLFQGVYDPDETQQLKDRFSALMAPTGRLRDLDVYLLDRPRFYGLLPPVMHVGLDHMFTIFATERKQQQAQLASHLKSRDYEKEISALRRLFKRRKKLHPGPNAARGAHDLACRLIWKRYRKICRIAAAIGPDTPDEQVHDLRIHCKKLRYLMEFFAPVFAGSDFDALLKPLKRLQDVLGLFNDYSVQQVALGEFARKLEGRDLAIAQSLGALIVVLHQLQLAERARVQGSFASFNSPQTQHLFRDLFHSWKGQP